MSHFKKYEFLWTNDSKYLTFSFYDTCINDTRVGWSLWVIILFGSLLKNNPLNISITTSNIRVFLPDILFSQFTNRRAFSKMFLFYKKKLIQVLQIGLDILRH